MIEGSFKSVLLKIEYGDSWQKLKKSYRVFSHGPEG
jgi:hypothetical protein